MYLKLLEIHGFKSFPDRVRFEFTEGITAVVGPNGSGKSNVSDAIRWVLGEQSAKSLRGLKMEDVIFSGAQGRGALGLAEVSLTLDNADESLPIGFPEVIITRRVYRSGEGEYLINGTAARLKDIHELLMDTGIGREGYSIIGQGRVDEILNARAEDRRYIFEEAAGIVKYKSRKAEAEAKLERERQNLIRTDDIMAELEARLEPLHKQSEIAHRYLELRERQKILQVNIFLNEVGKTDRELKSYSESLSRLCGEREAGEGRRAALHIDIMRLKEQIASSTTDIAAANENITGARLSIEQMENSIKLSEQRVTHINDTAGRLEDEIERQTALINEKGIEMAAEEAERLLLDSQLSEKLAVIAEHEDEFRLMNERRAADDKKVSDRNREIIELNNRLNEIRNSVNRLELSYGASEERKERVQEENIGVSEEHAGLLAEAEVIGKRLAESETEQRRLEEEYQKLSAEETGLRESYGLKSNESVVLQRELAETTAKHKALCELENDYEGYSRSVKHVLMLRASDPNRYRGIIGTVGELLRVPGEYETAIETALGGVVQNIVVADEDAAARAINALKESRSGRATFLPLSAMKVRAFAMRDALSREKGYLGTAMELIDYDECYAGVVSQLLGRVAVVDTMENAAVIFKKYRYELKIVTPGGELFNPGGAITGGSVQRRESGLIGRSRRIHELGTRLELLNAKKRHLNNELEKMRCRLEIITDSKGHTKEALDAQRSERRDGVRELGRVSERVSRLAVKITELEAEDRTLMDKLAVLTAEIRVSVGEVMRMEREVAEKEKALEDFEAELAAARESRNARMVGLMALKAEAGALEQKCGQSERNIERIRNEIGILNGELERNKAGTVQLAEEHGRIMEEIERIGMGITQKRDELEGIRSRARELDGVLKGLHAGLNEKEERERTIFEEITITNAGIARLEARKEQLEADIRKMYDNMWEEYQITYISAKEYPAPDIPATALVREERKVRGEIARLGEVNVNAIEEYKTIKTRYDFLTAQRNDIIAAEGKLAMVIKELVSLMESRFTEQFERISESFGIVYREIFGGGNAYLRLTDKGSALSSGIEIVSQPPGKTLNNMSLLSGGEHALTAIALLFGILRLKPSPFCVLDEIESALDDANVARFANFLKNFERGTQFVVITHRKRTMEAADVLYGITMQEQGISKPVSVRFAKEAV